MRWLAVWMCVLGVAGQAVAADYAREQRWADEVTPTVLNGDVEWLPQANGHKFLGLYLQPEKAKAGLIIVHGMGVHPDWEITGALRAKLAELGYATLSIQMPVQAKEARPGDYVETFPEAAERIRVAAGWLKSKGLARIAVVSHSLGGRMAGAFFRAGNPAPVSAWASISMGFDDYKGVRVPVFDLYAEDDHPPVMEMTQARKATLSKGSKQQRMAGAEHFYVGKEHEAASVVATWLDQVLKPRR